MDPHFPCLRDVLPCFGGQGRRVENNTLITRNCYCTRCHLRAWDFLRTFAQSSGKVFLITIGLAGISFGDRCPILKAESPIMLWAKQRFNNQSWIFYLFCCLQSCLEPWDLNLNHWTFNYRGKEGNQKTSLVSNLKSKCQYSKGTLRNPLVALWN